MSRITEMINQFVEETTKQIVDEPSEVNVSSSISTKTVIVQIKVAQTDCGKIIGKHGRTIDAMKVLCLAIKNTNFPDDSRRVILEVLEDEDSSFRYNR